MKTSLTAQRYPIPGVPPGNEPYIFVEVSFELKIEGCHVRWRSGLDLLASHTMLKPIFYGFCVIVRDINPGIA
jgi:hypothetical protein